MRERERDRQTDRQTDRQRERERHTYRQTDRQVNRQINRHTDEMDRKYFRPAMKSPSKLNSFQLKKSENDDMTK